jgi:hypothetical protein
MHQLVQNMYHEQVHQPFTRPIQNLYHEQVHQPCTIPVQNLYHEQVHQPCTKPVKNVYHEQVHQPCKPKAGEKHVMLFLIFLEELHSLEAPTSFFFPAATRRRLQPASFLGYNLREAPTP